MGKLILLEIKISSGLGSIWNAGQVPYGYILILPKQHSLPHYTFVKHAMVIRLMAAHKSALYFSG